MNDSMRQRGDGDAYHWPPDLLQLLIDTVPRLVRSKQDVLGFFRGCGASRTMLDPLQSRLDADPDRLNKFQITREILTALNERGDAMLRVRREVLRRVVEFESFEVCWPNDALPARGLVSQVRSAVNRRDSFTRMRDAAEAAQAERRFEAAARATERAQKRADLAEARKGFHSVFSEADPWKRGKALEGALNRIFGVYGILIDEAFTVRGGEREGVVEQIDGVIRLEGPCLVEMKWHSERLGASEAAPHLVRVYNRPDSVKGLLISASGFTDAAITAHREAIAKGRTVVLCDLEELVHVLEEEADLEAYLRDKMDRANIHREAHFRPALR